MSDGMYGAIDDMGEGRRDDVRRGTVGMEYGDEQTWNNLVPILVEQGEKAELDRSNKMGVHE